MKVLLLSDLPPCVNHTGGLFLDRLCSYLIESGCEVFGYIVKNDEVYTELPEDKKELMDFRFDRKPKENMGRIKNQMASFLYDNYVNFFEIPRIKSRIKQYITEKKPDIIWGVIQGQTMTKLVRPIAKECKLKYIIQFYDSISWWFQANCIDGFTQRRVMKEYGRMLKESYCFIGASDEMAKDYSKKYGCNKSVGIVMPFDKGNSYSQKKDRDDDIFVIAISGQLYARSTIASLMDALTQMDWQCNGKQIIFRIYGPEVIFCGLKNVRIEYRGWIDQEQLLNELNEADLLYCPYRFDEDFREVASYSFPGKLSTYMKTGVPILVHAPDYSTIARFIRCNNCGYIIESVNIDIVRSKLQEIVSDDNSKVLVQRANETANTFLSEEVTKNKMLYAVGLAEKY